MGRGIALALAEVGADVAVASRTQAQVEGVAMKIQELGQPAVAVPAEFAGLANVSYAICGARFSGRCSKKVTSREDIDDQDR